VWGCGDGRPGSGDTVRTSRDAVRTVFALRQERIDPVAPSGTPSASRGFDDPIRPSTRPARQASAGSLARPARSRGSAVTIDSAVPARPGLPGRPVERDPGRKRKNPGDDLFSRKAALSVSSALESLTSVFGMGTGVASPLESPGFPSGCGRRPRPPWSITTGGADRSKLSDLGVVRERRSRPAADPWSAAGGGQALDH
jgi:hypothetical protein